MKILFLSSWFPYPPINGAKIRIYNLIRQLAKNHQVSLISQVRTLDEAEVQDNIAHLEKYCRVVKVFPAKEFSSEGMTALRGFFSLKPRSVVHSYNNAMAGLVEEEIKRGGYDIVVASEVGPPSATSLIASNIKGVPVVLDALEVANFKEAYQNQHAILTRLRRQITWLKLRKFTGMLLERTQLCTVPSREEKDNLTEIFADPSKIKVIPHALDLSYYDVSFAHPEPNSIVFTGSFSYFPNYDAADYFIQKIYPIVKENQPEVSLRIVGSTNGMEADFLRADGSIRFTGLIKDVRRVVAESWLSVVPLRLGAGTRLKIIESMALGTPVISTSKGAEGLEVTDRENILIADTPEAFAEALLLLLQNPELRQKLSDGGRRLVRRKYDSDILGQNFEALIALVSSK